MFMMPIEFKFLSVCHICIHFHSSPTVEVNEIYEKKWKKWSLKLQYLIIVQSNEIIKVKFVSHNEFEQKKKELSQNIVFTLNIMLLLVFVYFDYDRHSKWNVLEKCST